VFFYKIIGHCKRG